MTPFEPDDRDPLLEALFRVANPPLADAGFSERVLAQLRRRARVREAVLALAAAAGIALALLPASRLVVDVSERLTVASLQWSDTVQQRLQRALPDRGPSPG